MSDLPLSITRGTSLAVIAAEVSRASSVTPLHYVERRADLYRWSAAHRRPVPAHAHRRQDTRHRPPRTRPALPRSPEVDRRLRPRRILGRFVHRGRVRARAGDTARCLDGSRSRRTDHAGRSPTTPRRFPNPLNRGAPACPCACLGTQTRGFGYAEFPLNNVAHRASISQGRGQAKTLVA